MSLQDIANTLRNGVREGRLNLDATLLDAPGCATLLNLLETRALDLELDGAGVAVEGETVKVSGRTTLLGAPASVSLLLEQDAEGETACTLNAHVPSLTLSALTQYNLVPATRLDPGAFPPFPFEDVTLTADSKRRTLSAVAGSSSQEWKILDDANLSLRNVGFAMSRSVPATNGQGGGQKDVRLSLMGTVELGGTAVDVAVAPPVNALNLPDQWGLTVSAEGSFATGLSGISKLLTGSDTGLELPPGLKEIASFKLELLDMRFNPAAREINTVTLTLSSTEPWELAPSVTIEQVRLSLLAMQGEGRRIVSTEIFGRMRFGERSRLGVRLVVPGGGRDWSLTLTEPLSLSGLAQLANLPGGLRTDSLQLPPELSNANLWLNRFDLTFNPTRRTIKLIAVGLSSDIQWNIISRLAIGRPSVRLEIANPLDGAQRAITGGMSGVLIIGGASLYVGADKADVNAGWQLKANSQPGETIKLTEIARDMLGGAPLPDEVPDLEFSDIEITVMPSTGAFTFRGTAKASWDLPFGVAGLSVTSVDIDVQKGAATGTGAERVPGPVSCSLRLNIEGPVTVVEGLVFKKMSLGLDLDTPGGGQPDSGSTWKLSGSVAARIFDADYTLAVALERTAAQRKISLTAATTAATLINFDGVGSLSAKSVTINIVKQLQPAAPAPPDASAAADGGGPVSLSPSSPYTWDVTIVGGLKVTDVLNLEGTLRLFSQAERAGFTFVASNAEARVPLPIPEHSAALHFALNSVSVVRSTTPSGASAWSFDAATQVWFTGLPEHLQKLLAQRVAGRFKVDGDGVQVSVNRVLEPLELNIPDAHAGSIAIELGTMALDASNLMFAVKGGALSLSMDFGVGLPEKLNNVFGKKPDGTPAARVFNTYVRGVPDSISKFRVGISTADGVNIHMVTSPFAGVRLTTQGLDTWWDVDLGEFGRVKLLVPVFNYGGDSFTARGGFEQVEPLKIPLMPLKALLSAVGLGSAAASLPRGIPLQDLDIYDSATRRFKFDEFAATLETLGGFVLPPEVRATLRAIEQRLDAMPDRFKSYLDIEIPRRFEFDISITPDGGARGKIWVTGDKPLKFLYPTMGPLGPVLNGIELYSITFGEMLGGSLMLLNVDARFDSYDLLLLVATAALPLDQLPILPDTRQLMRRVIVKDLFMVIIYQTGVPIPVPLFFGELGLEYLGLEGLELQTHWGFPKPHLRASEAARIFKDFENFFRHRDHLLDADHPPQGLDLKLVIGPNYIQLPKYLGSKSLGSREEKIYISAYRNLAHLLNAIKTFSLNELIQAMPLEKRVGHEQVSFASMTLMADWLITTPGEFREISYRRLGVADDQITSTLQVLPSDAGQKDQGLVIFLKGSWSIAGAASLGAAFGLVGTPRGFGTGLRLSGQLAGLLDVEMGGTVVIDTKATDVFALQGHSHLRVLGDEVFSGDLRITEHSLTLSGRLDLMPRSPAIRITGQLSGHISDREFLIAGSAAVSVGGFFTLAAAAARVDQNGVIVSGTWLDQTATFAVVRVGAGLQLEGSLSPVNVGGAFRITDDSGAAGPRAVIGLTAEELPTVYVTGRITLLGISAGGTVNFSERGFQFTVEGHIFNLFQATVTARGANLLDGDGFYIKATMRNDLLAYLREHASKAINDAAASATRQLSDAQAAVEKARQDVGSLERQINDMRNTVQQERARDQERLNSARREVEAAQNKVNELNRQIEETRRAIEQERARDQERLNNARRDVEAAQNRVNELNRQIEEMRRTVEGERYRDQQGLRNAQAAVADAQRKVDGLQNQINDANNTIARLKREIDDKKRWYDGLPWYQKTYAWADVAAFCTGKGTEITAQYTAIGALEASKATANGVLELAKLTLRGLEQTSKTFPVDADPRVAGLITAREAATAGLNLAQGTLGTVQSGIKLFPVDADPRITGLFAARETATGALNLARGTLSTIQAGIKLIPVDADPRVAALITARATATAALNLANETLQRLKISLGALAQVGDFIIRNGLGNLLDVRAASFEASLNAAQGGSVTLSAEVVYMGTPRAVSFAFNFHNPLQSVQDFARTLLT